MVRKQSSARVSSMAARLLRSTEGTVSARPLWVLGTLGVPGKTCPAGLTIRELRMLCASVLSQDETKGQRKVKKRKAR